MRTYCKYQEGPLDQGGNALKWVMRGESPGRKSWTVQGRGSLKVGNSSWEQIIPAGNSLAQFPGMLQLTFRMSDQMSLLRAAFSDFPIKPAPAFHCPPGLSSAFFFSKYTFMIWHTVCSFLSVVCLSLPEYRLCESGLGRLWSLA